MDNQSKGIFNYKEMSTIEELLEMRTGYVLDFSNNTFRRFIVDSIGIDIYSDKGYEEYQSKANKLRQIITQEKNCFVSKLVIDLMNYYEDYKLKKNKLTEYDKKKIKEIKDICYNYTDDICRVEISEELNEKIKLISTRNAKFDQMMIDEKLKEIGNLIEYFLKEDNKFIEIDYSFSSGIITKDDVIKYRKKIQCFRHASKESLIERQNYTKNQKRFLVEYGVLLCTYIYNQIKK